MGKPESLRVLEAQDRQALATDAAYEIEAIARVLQGLEHTSDNEYVMRGLFLRLEALAGVVMSVTGFDEDRSMPDMRAVVFGLRHGSESRSALEVQHG